MRTSPTARKDAAKEEKENPDWDDKKKIEVSKKKLNERIKQEEQDATEHIDELHATLKLLETVQKQELITEDQYRALERLLEVAVRQAGHRPSTTCFRAGLGGTAIKELLSEIDLEKLARELRKEISPDHRARSGPARSSGWKSPRRSSTPRAGPSG